MTSCMVVPVGSTRPERELVLLCARLGMDGEAQARVGALLEQPLDWDEVLEWAGYHHVTPLLHYHLDRPGTMGVPEAAAAALRKRYHRIAARNLKLMAELRELVLELEAAGAPAVIWKGPVLARSVYPSPELRTFGDLDLIIRREDRERARAVFSRRGYGAPPGSLLSEAELFDADARDATLWNPDTSIPLDVHWGAVRRYYSPATDFQVLWNESEPFDLLGSTVQALRRDTHFLALCVHGAKHGPFPWPAVKWVTDMEAFLRTSPEAWWPPVLDRARRLGCLRMMLLGTLLAREILEAPVPQLLEEAMAEDRHLSSLVPPIRWRMLHPDRASFHLGDRIAFDLAVRERARDRARYRLTRLLSPGRRDEIVENRPRLRLFRIPLRLLRLARAYLFRPGAVRALLRGEGGDREGRGGEDGS